MAEKSLTLTKVVRLASGELSQTTVKPSTPWPLLAIAGILLVGVAWWAAAGDE